MTAVGQYLSGIKLKAFDVRKLSQMSTEDIVQYNNLKTWDIYDISTQIKTPILNWMIYDQSLDETMNEQQACVDVFCFEISQE